MRFSRAMATFGANLLGRENIGELQAVGESLYAVTLGEYFRYPEPTGPLSEESVLHDYLSADLQSGVKGIISLECFPDLPTLIHLHLLAPQEGRQIDVQP